MPERKIAVGSWWQIAVALSLLALVTVSYYFSGIFSATGPPAEDRTGEFAVIAALVAFIGFMSVPYFIGIARGDLEREMGPFVTTGQARGTSRFRKGGNQSILYQERQALS
jgi:hypothetical protein